jgi:hypothetical protein
MQHRLTLFDPEYGIGLSIDAGSGRSWLEQPDGDPVCAHLRLDVPADSLVVSDPRNPPLRCTSDTGFVRWGGLLRFGHELEALAGSRRGAVVLDASTALRLTVRLRLDGRVRAEAAFRVRHRVDIDLKCRTRWDWHNGERRDLAGVSEQVRAAIEALRPARPTRR